MVAKFRAIILILVMIFFTLPLSATDDLAPPAVDYEKEYNSFISSIPDEIAELLPRGIFSEDVTERTEAVTELTEPVGFLGIILDMLGFYMKDALGMFARLMALVLLSALAHAMFGSMGNKALREPFSLCTTAAIVAAVIGEQTEMIRMADQFLERLLTLVNSMIPLIGVLYAAGGNVSTAAAGTASLSLFLSICENLCGITLMPAVGICLAFSAASAFSSHLSLGEISGTFKRMYTYGLGLLMAIMALVMGMQNQLTAKADSLSARAAKYAVGSFIPVVGGAVGDSLRTVAASVEYIRSAVGGIAIIVIIILLLPPLISLALGRSAVNISSSAAKMMGCEREGRLLSEIGNIYGYMMAVCSICSVIFIYALTLFIRCSAAAGG
ncbi:MAG: hypothetical protein IJZ89_05790 [Clostridia bacterium]|nr:hypothetical protein [Clostridia bacterium]